MSNYLIELSLIHLILILGYWFILRKEQQYAKMRFYLIAATLLSLLIPLLKLPKVLPSDPQQLQAIVIEAVPSTTNIKEVTYSYNDGYYIVTILFYAVSLILLFKLLGNIIYLVYLERKSKYEKFNDIYIRKVSGIKGSFSFFNWIFLSDEIAKEQKDYHIILKHEKAHTALGHTYDLIFFELFKVCFWWLPTSWFILKEVKKIHEYQADAFALKTYNLDQYSSILINSTLKLNGLSVVSSFHDGLILKRLIEMKKQTKNVSPWKLGTLSALCALLIFVFACSEENKEETFDELVQNSEIDDGTFTKVEEGPEFEGGFGNFYQYMANEVKYPAQARKLGIEGRVKVEFIVEKDGQLSNVKVVEGIGAGCDGEAVRVIENSPSFKPGKQRGKAVRVKMQLPIIFKLNESKLNEDNTTQGMVILEEVVTKNSEFKVEASYSNGVWAGTISDENNDKLPGVNIVVGGATSGTVSDLDGSFKLKANKDQEIYLSFVGYETVKLKKL